ncbi:MAG TPA: ABC transporter ATP-binding protein, partial [Turneriella sp.]|nr:ABC transporter ATP-binding protein [Turneriella sp.]
ALAIDPDLLFLDEPTAGLDPVLTDAIAELIKGIKRNLGSTAIVVAHDFNLAYKLADKIGLMVSGNLHTVMTRDEFRTTSEPYVEQFREGKLTGPIPVIE